MTALRRVAIRGPGILLIVLFGALLVAGSASAHATLQSSSPASQSVLDRSPGQIALQFDEQVDIVPGSIRLVAADGTAVDIGIPGHGQSSSSLTASVPSLADGTYVVAWRAISADSHPVSGAFTFSVHSATTPAPGLVDKLLAADHPSSTVEFALGVGRWLSYAGLAVLLGVLGMLAICAPELLRGRRAAWLLGAGCVLGVVGTAWMIAAQSSLQIGHPFRFDAWKAVAETHAGRWWAVRLGLFLVGALLIPLVKRMRIDNVWSVVAIVYAAAMLGTVTAGGHGVTGRWIAAGFLATAVHLAAMSLWVGGLVALVVCVPNRERWPVAAKFSRLAFFSVVVLAFTGVVNAWRQSSSLSALIHSTYGTWLWIKLVVVAGVLVVAWFSRRRARSRGAPQGEGDPAVRIRMFRRLVLSEVLGVAAVLALTAGLVSSAPPRQLALAPESVTVVVGDRIAQVVLAPPVAGGTEMHVYISSVSTSLATPVAMSVTASLASKGITNLPLTMSVAAPGHLTGGDVDLPVAGAWTLTITARYSEFDQSIFTVPVSVR